jgi:hypothetical protein
MDPARPLRQPFMFADAVDRLLLDAEAAARRGDGDLALDLLAVALDTASGDGAVLVRGVAIQNIIAEQEDAARLANPFFLNEDEIGLEGGAGLALEGTVAFGAIGDDQILEAIWSPGNDSNAWTSPETQAGGGAERQAPARQQARLPRSVLYAAWAAVGTGVLLAVLLLVSPAALSGAQAIYARLFDPYTKAIAALDSGRHADAFELAMRAAANPKTTHAARLVAARAAIAIGDTASAVASARQAYGSQADWSTAYHAGLLLQSTGRLEYAAGALLHAFQKGAPEQYWAEIAEAQQRAGYTDRANRLRELLARGAGFVTPAEAAWAAGETTE